MKNALIAALIALAITYALDAYFFKGYYYRGLSGFIGGITRSFR